MELHDSFQIKKPIMSPNIDNVYHVFLIMPKYNIYTLKQIVVTKCLYVNLNYKSTILIQ